MLQPVITLRACDICLLAVKDQAKQEHATWLALLTPELLCIRLCLCVGCRYFIVFQSIEDNLVFRTACADLAAKSLDLER